MAGVGVEGRVADAVAVEPGGFQRGHERVSHSRDATRPRPPECRGCVAAPLRTVEVLQFGDDALHRGELRLLQGVDEVLHGREQAIECGTGCGVDGKRADAAAPGTAAGEGGLGRVDDLALVERGGDAFGDVEEVQLTEEGVLAGAAQGGVVGLAVAAV
ncbi:MAG: hypothetical protein ACREVK_13820 [Gammaproteobacteria bacterium]